MREAAFEKICIERRSICANRTFASRPPRHWIAELGENFDDDLNRVVPFEYSAELTAAMKLHGITDPHTAWTVFSARAEALLDLRDRL